MGLKLFVGNLSFETTDQDLKDAFAKAGTCASAAVIKDRLTGRPRGFGFVEMGSDDEAQRAISALNGTLLQGRDISVSQARERAASRGPRPGGWPGYGPPPGPAGPHFRKSAGSRRGVRGRKRSL